MSVLPRRAAAAALLAGILLSCRADNPDFEQTPDAPTDRGSDRAPDAGQDTSGGGDLSADAPGDADLDLPDAPGLDQPPDDRGPGTDGVPDLGPTAIGQPCTTSGGCASGFCVRGVCCN